MYRNGRRYGIAPCDHAYSPSCFERYVVPTNVCQGAAMSASAMTSFSPPPRLVNFVRDSKTSPDQWPMFCIECGMILLLIDCPADTKDAKVSNRQAYCGGWRAQLGGSATIARSSKRGSMGHSSYGLWRWLLQDMMQNAKLHLTINPPSSLSRGFPQTLSSKSLVNWSFAISTFPCWPHLIGRKRS